MKQFALVFLFLVTFLSARAVEVSCFCFDDTATHSESKTTKTDKTKDDHCQHTCSQCHFAAVIPIKIVITKPDSLPETNPSFVAQQPQDISSVFYRPPIA